MLEQQQQSLRPYDQPQGYLQPSWANGWASAPLAQASSAEQQMSSFVNLGLAGFVPGPNPSLPGWPSSGTPDAPTSPFPPVANFNYQQAIAQAAFRNLAAAIPPAQLPYGLPGVRPGAPDAPTDPYPAQAAASQQLALAALLGQMQAGFAAATPSGQSAATPPPFPDLAAQLSNPAALAAAAAANPWALMLAATAAAGATGALPPAAWRASHPNLDQHVAVESAMVEQSRGSSSDPDEVSEGSKSLVRKSHNRHGGLNHQQADTRGRDDSPDHNDNGSSRHRMETNEHAFGGRHKSHEVAGQAAVDNRRLKEPSPPTPTVAPVPPAPQPAAPAPAATADDCTSMPPPPPRPHTLDSTSGSGPISTASLEHIRALLGPQQWSSVRVTLLKQQQQFVQQLFELHKLSQVQKLLSAELMCADLMNVEPLPLPERCPSATGAANGPHVSWSGLPPPRRSSTVMPAAVSHPSTNQAPMDMDLPVGVESHRGGAVPTMSVGLEKRLQQDFAHLVNIPGPLRHKAGSASPDQANTGSGIGKEATGTASAQALLESLLPLQKEAWARPGVLRPQALRLCPDSGPTQSVSVVQPSMSNSEAGPTPIGMVNALEAAVLGSGPAHADPYSIPQRPGLASEPLHALHAQQAPYTQQVDMAAASKSSLPPTASLSGLPVVPAPIGRNLMEAAAALLQSAGGIPPLPLPQLAAAALMQSSAGMPMMGDICASSANQLDPHAAWFSRHYGAQNNMSSLTSQPPAGTISNPQTSMIPSMGGGPQPSASGRWWQDEAATFGDVAPSALTHTPAVGVSTGAGNKRSLSTKGPGASGAGNKKVRSEDPGDAPVDRGAFKAVRPRKARSKRGSNRLGPPGSANGHTYNNGGHHSSPSDSDASHEGGSCVGGSAAVGPAGMIRPRNGVAKAPVTLPPPAAAPTRSGSLGLPLTMSAVPNSNSHDDNSLTGREDKSAAGILLSLCTAAVTDGHTVSKAQKRSNTPSPTRTVDRGGMGPISGAVGSPLVGQARA